MIALEEIKANSVVAVVGPTASGKSGLALELAKQYNGVIINADAMQVYRDTPILSASPSEEDKQSAEHLLYGVLAADTRGSVADWMKMAVEAIHRVWQEGKLPIVVGGTGFYIESLIAGISPIPDTKKTIKQQVSEILADGGVEELFARLQKVDVAGAALVNAGDTTRVRRALEIFLDTGCSIAEWYKKPLVRMLPEAEFVVIALLPDLQQLEDKCGKRFDAMMEQGALEEVRRLSEVGIDSNLPAAKAIGVPELAAYLEGKCSLEDAIKAAKLHTRQYAKRQLTWFRNRLQRLPAKIIRVK